MDPYITVIRDLVFLRPVLLLKRSSRWLLSKDEVSRFLIRCLGILRCEYPELSTRKARSYCTSTRKFKLTEVKSALNNFSEILRFKKTYKKVKYRNRVGRINHVLPLILFFSPPLPLLMNLNACSARLSPYTGHQNDSPFPMFIDSGCLQTPDPSQPSQRCLFAVRQV